MNSSLYGRYFKRILDVAVAFALFVLLAPLLLVIAFLVRIRLGPSVLYTQTRTGRHNRPFKLIKFRTMTTECNSTGELLPDEFRMTKLGRLLRASSLDELPGIWNVLRGEMSLVGPRPLLVAYLPRYSSVQARRHEVRPGITGLAQVRGRNAISWEEKFAHDVQYVDNHSLALDLWIFSQTVFAVFRRRGISADGHATMPEFMGSAEVGLSRRAA
ncbi:MAG: sugar transferase [Pirellulales bacterium]|nr:sugar transferase [Pirellulales bacterium]